MKPLLLFIRKLKHLIAITALLSAVCTAVSAQGTAFTYQGRLNDGASPASGNYDLRFTIYDAPAHGTISAGPATNFIRGMTNGLFAVTLDFGGGVFSGPGRWLNIEARTNGNGTFNTLNPRELLTPVPYATMANAANSLLGTLPTSQLSGTIGAAQLGGVYSNAVAFVNGDNSFSGSGAGLTNVTAAAVGAGVTNEWENYFANQLGSTFLIWPFTDINEQNAARARLAFSGDGGRSWYQPFHGPVLSAYGGNGTGSTAAGDQSLIYEPFNDVWWQPYTADIKDDNGYYSNRWALAVYTNLWRGHFVALVLTRSPILNTRGSRRGIMIMAYCACWFNVRSVGIQHPVDVTSRAPR